MTRRSTIAFAALLVLVLAGFAHNTATSGQQETWEYHMVYGQPTPQTLNGAGAEGWELVSVVHVPRSYSGSFGRLGHERAVDVAVADAMMAAVFKRRAR